MNLREFLAYLGQSPALFFTVPFEGGNPAPHRITPDNWESWQNDHQGANVYYSLAKSKVFKKPNKVDLSSTQFLHVDLDPDMQNAKTDLYERLSKFPITPSLIIDSGRGFQGLWKLRAPLQLPEYQDAVEIVNRWLITNLKAPLGTHNVDRLLRAPGFINVGNEKKGHLKFPTYVVDATGLEYTLEDFPVSVTKKELVSADGEPIFCDSHDLCEVATKYQLFPQTTDLISNGHPGKWLDEYKELHGEPNKDANDRSIWVYHVVCDLARAGVPDEVAVSLLTNKSYAISEHVHDQKVPAKKYAARQMERARETVAKNPPRERTPQRDPEAPNEGPGTMETDKNGFPVPKSVNNVKVGISRLRVNLKFNLFSHKMEINGKEVRDSDERKLWYDLELKQNVKAPISMVRDVADVIAHQNTYDPVIDYFTELEKWFDSDVPGPWNGHGDRLSRLLPDYFGAEDNELNQTYGKLWMTSIARRQLEPGAKFDEILVLVSPEGWMKSSTLRNLCPKAEWFNECFELKGDRKAAMEATDQKIMVEASDLSHMTKNVNGLKAYLSSMADEARMAYGRHATRKLRRFGIVGTTNQTDFLTGNTGNRRWWPVQLVRRVNGDSVLRDKEMLWAEAWWHACQGFRNKEQVRLPQHLWSVSGSRQRDFHEISGDPWYDKIAEELARFEDCFVSSSDLWVLIGKNTGQLNNSDKRRLVSIMEDLKWDKGLKRIGNVRRRGFGLGAQTRMLRVDVDARGNAKIGYVNSKENF